MSEREMTRAYFRARVFVTGEEMATRLVLFVSGMMLALLVSSAHAQTLRASVERQLSAQGYRDIDMSRTLLGRARFEARKGNMTRVIVVNPNTGEVLRDMSRATDAEPGKGLVDILGDAIFGDGDADGGGDSGAGHSDGGDSDGGDGDGDGGDGEGGDGDGDGGDGDGDGDGDGGDGD